MCVDCFQNCNGNITTDRCVKYTGADVALLGIKNGDPISLVEKIIIESLLKTLDGTGIALSELTIDCSFLEVILGGKDKNLVNILQMLITANCSLKTLITTLESKVNKSYSFNTDCLSGLPADPSTEDVLQAVANKLCSLVTDVTTIKNDYVKASELNTLVAQYLTNSTPTTVQQNTKLVPFVAYEYYGSLSNFDSTGKGLSSAGFDKVYLCNGLNGTPDRRGRTAVGAVQNVPGGALDAAVDPIENPGANYALKQKFGTVGVTLSTQQLPAHNHPVTDPGHKHLTKSGWSVYSNNDSTGKSLANDGGDAVDFDTKTNDGLQVTQTGVTVGNAGGNQPHPNVQPSIGAYFIMYIP